MRGVLGGGLWCGGSDSCRGIGVLRENTPELRQKVVAEERRAETEVMQSMENR